MRGQKPYVMTCLLALAMLITLWGCGGDDPVDPVVNPGGGDPGGDPGDDPGGENAPVTDAIVADHTYADSFADLDPTVFAEVRQAYDFYYGHTSHGSQIMTGLSLLAAEDDNYDRPSFHELGDDLGHNGDISWATRTRQDLDANPGTWNAVLWSWCGGVSDNTPTGIDTYLQTMNALESDYPGVLFIYMTGHLDGSGSDGNLRARNDQIRQYCLDNDKVLFDFAEIESYDPAGNFYPDESDACHWCETWCDSHDCSFCDSGCAHSHCFNCYRKGMAFWSLMAEVVLSTD